MSFKGLELVALVASQYLASCATGKGIAITACLSDPPTSSMLCRGPEGSEFDIPWKDSGDMVCLPRFDYRDLYTIARSCK